MLLFLQLDLCWQFNTSPIKGANAGPVLRQHEGLRNFWVMKYTGDEIRATNYVSGNHYMLNGWSEIALVHLGIATNDAWYMVFFFEPGNYCNFISGHWDFVFHKAATKVANVRENCKCISCNCDCFSLLQFLFHSIVKFIHYIQNAKMFFFWLTDSWA